MGRDFFWFLFYTFISNFYPPCPPPTLSYSSAISSLCFSFHPLIFRRSLFILSFWIHPCSSLPFLKFLFCPFVPYSASSTPPCFLFFIKSCCSSLQQILFIWLILLIRLSLLLLQLLYKAMLLVDLRELVEILDICRQLQNVPTLTPKLLSVIYVLLLLQVYIF